MYFISAVMTSQYKVVGSVNEMTLAMCNGIP